ncbi:homoserine O-succinyltransferase [Dyella sp. GSA-30]|uniref:homoserine O-succinyltransferase MetX n=1 Tax=Dyella sp. GSA-30 TaxID=2994496 RepID=UPI002492FD42|nr:homoserine O-succinyltransferase [Dyella sp. GSA-30]BDU20254.1 homoserine O-acetyltransferase [Dyella sp. GSA-30]
MPSQANPVPPPVFAATSLPAAAARGDLTAQRSTRRVTLTPKYGATPCEVDVRYLWCGAPDAPTVIVQGGISADRDAVTFGDQAAGWWQEFIGAGRTVDLDRYRVLSIDWLTPAELGHAQAISSEDQADALAALVDALGIGRVHAFIGYSYGGMTGLAFAARHPYLLDRLVLLGSAHRPHPLATAQRSVQRSIVRLGVESGQPEQALALARQLAMTTYRGSEEFVRRFASAPEYRDGRFHFPVEDYLEQAGRQFVARFDIDRYLALSESIDLHDVRPEQVPTRTTLIGTPSDRLVPLADLCELQRRLQGPASLEVIDSPYGHDAFLKESDRLAPLLREALA